MAYSASSKLESFKRRSTLQVKMTSGVSPALSLEMLAYIAKLERILFDNGLEDYYQNGDYCGEEEMDR